MANMFGIYFFFAISLRFAIAKERVYYIAIREEYWDYAPSGKNLVTGVNLTNDTDSIVFYSNATNRIGGKYKKAIYRQYGNDAFDTEIPKDPTLGFLGPTIIGEVGDVITIHAKNFASRNFSLHPHGSQYLKASEGALYVDGTPPEEKIIMPGASTMLTWNFLPEYGPTDSETDCHTWMYHSHIDTVPDSYSGLMGGLLVCKPGTLYDQDKRTDVDLSFLLMFFVVDENLSWYIDENIQEFCSDPNVDKEDEDFQESNKMHSINGLAYGNLEGLVACQGDTIAWNLFGLGNEVDLHSAHFERQTVISSLHRQDTIKLFPAVFKSVQMIADNPGSSLITCKVNDHYTAGMLTTFSVNSTCGATSGAGESAVTKKIYIAIEEQEWNYGPSGMNLLSGASLNQSGSDSATFFTVGSNRIGGTYKKALFMEYLDENFTTEGTRENHRGLLGPLIAVEVGDVIEVTLKNMATVSYNIEPHGLLYEDTDAVSPNSDHTYTWRAPDSVSPTELDPDCVTYLYTSSVDPVKDAYSGLVGPLLVCKRGTLANAVKRKAYYLLFSVMDENNSHYIEENIQTYATDPSSVQAENEDFNESNLMHSINGLMYGNLEEIDLCLNEETDFHVIGLGTEVDMHSMFMTGANIQIRKENTAVVSVFPHTTASLTITPESIGIGQIKCLVVDHLIGGMLTTYNVTDCGTAASTEEEEGRTLVYYIGVVEEDWDYATNSRVDILGRSLDDPETPGYTFAHNQNGSFIGSVYKKALYYQYSDSPFTKRMEKSTDLGLLGPVISGEEGDIINVIFKNMAESISYSIVPRGAKDINDPFNSKTGGVKPGTTETFKWKVPSSAVPQSDQPGCTSWVYQSNVDETKDVYSGLIGPLLLCRKGELGSNGLSKNFDRDFFLLFTVFDENNSNYLDDNIQTFVGTNPSSFDATDDDFVESNLMHSINGVLYGNGGLQSTVGETVVWHLIGYGNEVDIHTVHFHAHAFTYVSDVSSHDDVFRLFPGKIGTVQMNITEPGVWLFHCHVDDHLEAGMIGTYTVNEPVTTSDKLEGWQIALICIGCVLAVSLLGSLIGCLCCKKSRKA